MVLTAGRRPSFWILITAFVCLFGSAVYAQPVSDPNIAEFTPSADHNAVDGSGTPIVSSYSLAFFNVGGTTPILTVNLGKPSPDLDGKIRVTFRSLATMPAAGI